MVAPLHFGSPRCRAKSHTTKGSAAAHLGNLPARSTPAKYVGRVEAADADAAIEAATKEFEVKDPKRLIAVRRA
jgi:hypothetical protein